MEDCFHIAFFCRMFTGSGHILQHARIALKIEIHIALRFAARDPQLTGKTKCTHAVNQAEVDRLRAAALIRRHFVQRHTKHFGGGGAVDILAFGKGFQQPFVL